MHNCKKYRPTQPDPHSHHRNPTHACQNCAYFTQKNCGQHPQLHSMIV